MGWAMSGGEAEISEDQRAAIDVAVSAVTGSAKSSTIVPILGGVSGALVCRIDTNGSRYVLRRQAAATRRHNPHQYHAMRVAADMNLAPRIHYLDEDAGIVVMAFIEDHRLETYPGGPRGLAVAVGELLAKLQDLPSFQHVIAYPDVAQRLWTKVRQSGMFVDGVLDPYSEKLACIIESYVWESARSVAGHNDLLPRNLLFDGHRLWLIDWEGASLNDPLIDVGTALDNFAPSPELEEVLLTAWRRRPLVAQDRDRLRTVRAFNRLAYASILFTAAAQGRTAAPIKDLSALTSIEFENAFREGRLKPETPEASLALGKMFLRSFLTAEAAPGLPPLFMR